MENEYLLQKVIELLIQAGISNPQLIKKNTMYYTVEGTNVIVSRCTGTHSCGFKIRFSYKDKGGDYIKFSMANNVLIFHRRLTFTNYSIEGVGFNLNPVVTTFIDYGNDKNFSNIVSLLKTYAYHKPISISSMKKKVDEDNNNFLTVFGQVARELKTRIIFY